MRKFLQLIAILIKEINMLDDIEPVSLEMGNSEGGLWIRRLREVCEWSVEAWDGHNWYEITPKLFEELYKLREIRGEV